MANLWFTAMWRDGEINDHEKTWREALQHGSDQICQHGGLHEMGFRHPDKDSPEHQYGDHYLPLEGGIHVDANPHVDYFHPEKGVTHYKVKVRLSDSEELGDKITDQVPHEHFSGGRFDELNGIHPDLMYNSVEPASMEVKHAHQLPDAVDHLLKNRDSLNSIRDAMKGRRLEGKALEDHCADHKPYHVKLDGSVDARSPAEHPKWDEQDE